MNKLYIKKLSTDAIIPTRGSKLAAGYDLFSTKTVIVESGDRTLINTDIAIKVPNGYYGRVAPRSGLSYKHSLDIGAGVIDEDYSGNIGVLLINNSKNNYVVKKGDRIAQLLLEKIINPEIEEVDNLDDTERKDGGFGSTGI